MRAANRVTARVEADGVSIMLPRLCVQVSQRDAERLRDVLNAVLPPERKLHLLSIAGDVEPELSGPFADDQDRLEAAQDYRRAHGDEDGLFRVNATGDVTVGTFSGGELEMPNPRACRCTPATGCVTRSMQAGGARSSALRATRPT